MAGRSYPYGGQAVIEGVMMRGPAGIAVAVRTPEGSILIHEEKVAPLTQRYRLLRLPVLRGVIALVDSLVLGVKTLTFSANAAMGEDEEPLGKGEMTLTMVLALVVGVGLFFLLPTFGAHYLAREASTIGRNLVEGLIRLALLIGYIVAIGRLEDIRRVFQYHGAEHKVINAFEAGERLDVTAVRPYETMHPRCGTSFLLIVAILTILLFSLIPDVSLVQRLVGRLTLIPVVAGIGYELLRLSGRYASNPLVRAVITPGLWLQRLTTGEPDDSQIEVAIEALGVVLRQDNPVP